MPQVGFLVGGRADKLMRAVAPERISPQLIYLVGCCEEKRLQECSLTLCEQGVTELVEKDLQ